MLRMIDPDRAQQLVLQATAAALPAERVSLSEALGRVLAEEVLADRDYPPFARALMDGYAVRLVDAGQQVTISGEVSAGQQPVVAVEPGCAVAVMTGAPCPKGTEAVVIVEHVRGHDAAFHAGQTIELPSADRVRPGQNVAPQGSEARAGALVLAPGTQLSPGGIAILAAVGRSSVKVHGLPAVAVIATGDELVAGEDRVASEKIRDSNGPMLAALARWVGVGELRVLRARDAVSSLCEALEAAAGCQVVVMSGGVSAGRYDLVPAALDGLGAETVFHKVTQKPGKPLLLARRDGQLILALPGNPVSSHLCFHRYVAPLLRKLTGRPPVPAVQQGLLAAPFSARSERTLFVQARAEARPDSGRAAFAVTPLAGRGSADLFAGARANVYLRLEPGPHALEPGAEVSFEWMAGQAEAT